jgi:hypothetical protein
MMQCGHIDPSILTNAIEWILSIKFASSFSSSIFQLIHIDSQYSRLCIKRHRKLTLKNPSFGSQNAPPKISESLVLCASFKEKMSQETSNAIKFKVHTMQISCQVLHVGWHPRSRHQPKLGMPLGECHAPRAFLFLEKYWDQDLQMARISRLCTVGTYTYGLHCVFIADASGACHTHTYCKGPTLYTTKHTVGLYELHKVQCGLCYVQIWCI